jgi:hypothetical protein
MKLKIPYNCYRCDKEITHKKGIKQAMCDKCEDEVNAIMEEEYRLYGLSENGDTTR